MALTLNPAATVEEITSFLKRTYQAAGKQRAVIAVSGGIDSATSVGLITRALGADNVYPLLLPYQDQSVVDAKTAVEWAGVPTENVRRVNIEPMVQAFAQELHTQENWTEHLEEYIDQLVAGDNALTKQDHHDQFNRVRLGNIMARCRMIVVYDQAKVLDALVCGTENKSEKYLGYITRYGDEASDVEPIHHLFKTQVRQLAEHLGVPIEIRQKAPSAGLWSTQTDEGELGFEYAVADQVLVEAERVYGDLPRALDQGEVAIDRLVVEGVSRDTVKDVLQQVQRNWFKQQVPYSVG